MKRTPAQLDRVFAGQKYLLHYRRTSRARWSAEARGDYVVFLLIAGHLVCEVSGASAELESGALLLDPGTTAEVFGNSSEYVTVTISPAHFLDAAARTGLVGSDATIHFRSPVVERDSRITQIGRDLAHELSHQEAGHAIAISALMEQLIVHLLRHHSNLRRSQDLELSRAGLVDRRIRRAIELMQAHLDQELPLEEIAAAAYLSPFHFARLFKKLTGASPHAYLASLRNARAQELLATTDLSISELSARVGYASPSHFTKAFRQATGLTPRAFRKAVVRS